MPGDGGRICNTSLRYLGSAGVSPLFRVADENHNGDEGRKEFGKADPTEVVAWSVF